MVSELLQQHLDVHSFIFVQTFFNGTESYLQINCKKKFRRLLFKIFALEFTFVC